MTPETLHKYNSKWSEVRMHLKIKLILSKHQGTIFCSSNYERKVILGDFSIYKKVRAYTHTLRFDGVNSAF
jgi:hypothetical protein